MPLVINEVEVVIEPPNAAGGDAEQHLTASVAFDETAFEGLLRFLAERQRRVLAD